MASTTLTPPKPKAPPKSDSSGHNGGGAGQQGFGGGGRWDSSGGWSVPARAYRTGMLMALAGITMLFAAFTSALVVRRGLGGDWVPTVLPGILYLNTAVLLASSATLEFARRSLNAGLRSRFSRWWSVTLGLGCLFIAGQILAWRDLVARGVYLSTNPSSSFFYLLTGAHGLHLLGGIGALCYVPLRSRGNWPTARQSIAVDLTALYWHFMDGLWVYILFLFMVRL